MPRVIGIDPGTVSIDLVGLEDGRVWLDRTLPTLEALSDPATFVALLREAGPPDLITGPSGYGLPLVRADQATETDLRLAFLAPDGDSGGLPGLRRLARLLASSGLPVLFTPGVIHLPTVPLHRKLNRIDLGTADKVAAAALGIWAQGQGAAGTSPRPAAEACFILLELGGAFTAGVGVRGGAIVDGVGGTSGPMGWRSSGGWDGEVAFLAGEVTKAMQFRGGAEQISGIDGPETALEAYVEGACRTVLALTVAVPSPAEILLSGRHADTAGIRQAIERRLEHLAPVRTLTGFATIAKQGAQGAALLADGLAGGRHREITDRLRLGEARGTVLDYLRVIEPDQARRRLGLE